ncbi:hypothetical protein THIOM_004125 [Candidatus Thiomargarita nelsonii]|uniref:Uncharacterized protein n=1 Tax=Candidatus Thiomargarita nelsonii TaxID=1003181 RepID=A0A176RWQ9_9GAMM|nr:hypothetical protein THIOM_004125 [Candidatus Thiomargarita nelsonii]
MVFHCSSCYCIQKINAIKLRATTRDCPYGNDILCRGNPLWLPLNLMVLIQEIRLALQKMESQAYLARTSFTIVGNACKLFSILLKSKVWADSRHFSA